MPRLFSATRAYMHGRWNACAACRLPLQMESFNFINGIYGAGCLIPRLRGKAFFNQFRRRTFMERYAPREGPCSRTWCPRDDCRIREAAASQAQGPHLSALEHLTQKFCTNACRHFRKRPDFRRRGGDREPILSFPPRITTWRDSDEFHGSHHKKATIRCHRARLDGDRRSGMRSVHGATARFEFAIDLVVFGALLVSARRNSRRGANAELPADSADQALSP